ncbi:MAG: hypothetical protein A3F35_02625 [Candidatus Woykebacteria bacterium RIFCSPHIGHO2_12_FULL_45_10]|uniref:STAS/SEC14 domain-containing protein n=1 Tax=Candidatus Woykebacteria bacterium RIFCSPHIGHO2_12_FULL_45_10 TaxID=1802603 RepID=A0A1G1WQJ8_9BACT|nr:MAG: hypothetical protein A3F35_02625 [Candidatus Woykebacteria bacterium RIFCSPHIGHO2_12_FULL_45_10]
MKSDQELLKTIQIDLDENEIINLVYLEDQLDPDNNTRQVELMIEGLAEIVSKHPGKKFNLLADLTPIGSGTYMSDRSKEILARAPVFKELLKIAVVSESFLMKTVVLTISIVTGKSESVKWFDNKEEALEWLKK